MVSFLWIVLCGAIVGMADVIPGVSGGTMAVVLGIYDDMINAIGNFLKNVKKNIKFLIPFAIGAGLAIVLFGKLVTFLLESYPMQVNFFFIGLILGSIPMIAKSSYEGGFKPSKVIFFVIGVAVMITLFVISPSDSTSVLSHIGVSEFILLLVSGFIASIAMIVPGISGSMMLLIFGVYYTIMHGVSEFNFAILIPAGIGILLGLVLGSKLIAICLEKFPQATYCVILGLVVGSIFPLIRNAGFAFNAAGVVSILLLAAGAIIAYLMSVNQVTEKMTHGEEK